MHVVKLEISVSYVALA